MAKLKRDEGRVIPAEFDYAACSGLSREMIETLGRVRPETLEKGVGSREDAGGGIGELLRPRYTRGGRRLRFAKSDAGLRTSYIPKVEALKAQFPELFQEFTKA